MRRTPVTLIRIYVIVWLLLVAGCATNRQGMSTTGLLRHTAHTGQAHAWEVENMQPNYLDLARELVSQGHYDVALRQLEKAREHHVDCPELYYLRGVCLRENGSLKLALQAFEKALSIGSRYAPALNGMGLTYESMGKGKQAIRAFERAVEYNPAQPEFTNNLGMALMKQNRLSQAEAFFLKCLELDPEYLTACNNLAICYCRQGRDDRALALLKSHYPLDVACHNMAVIRRMIKRPRTPVMNQEGRGSCRINTQ